MVSCEVHVHVYTFMCIASAVAAGEVVAGFVVRHPNGETEWEIIGSRSPQDAQVSLNLLPPSPPSLLSLSPSLTGLLSC